MNGVKLVISGKASSLVEVLGDFFPEAKWQLINGEAKNITDLAAKLGLKPSYVTRVLGLNNLAPDIVEAIVNGAELDGLSIAQIMKNIPEDWNEQRRLFGFPER